MLLGKHINKYYKRFWYCFLLGIVALVAVDVFHLYVPEQLGNITKLLTDFEKGLISDADLKSQCLMIGLITALVGVLMCVGRITWRLSIFYANTKIEAEIRDEMYKKAERLSQRFYHENKVGTVMSWFTGDVETITEFLGWGTIMLVDAFFLSILVLAKMFMLNWALTLISLLPIAFIAVWAFFAEKYLVKLWIERQESNDRLYDFTSESFSGIRVIKAFVKEAHQERKFDQIASKCRDLGVKLGRINNLFERFIDLLIYFIFALMLGFGGYFVYLKNTGGTFFGITINLEVDQLVTFIAYFDTLIWPLIALGQIITMHSRSKASLGRISAFLDQKEEILDESGTVDMHGIGGEISFNHLDFAFPGTEKNVLTDINLTIKKGERVGIVGKIGCGKTTLVDLLVRLYNVKKGSITIDGIDIMDADIKTLRDVISIVPQDNFLFSDTVKNNVKYGDLNASDEDVRKAIEFSCVAKDVDEFPNKENTMMGERGTTVSGGQKQRISMARAYLKNAPILILDDSVSAVDVNTEEAILENIAKERAGKTTLLIASRVSTVSHLDKIIVLNDGKLEAFGTPDEVLLSSPTFARMAMLQELENEEGIRRWTTRTI